MALMNKFKLFTFNKYRLKIAKDLHGLKNKDLAKIFDCSEVTVSSYLNENKSASPDREKTMNLCNALDLPMSFFEADSTDKVQDEQIFFRSYHRIKSQYRNSARAYSEFGIQTLEFFDSKLERLPKFQGFDIEKNEAALSLRGEWKLGLLPINNIISLLELHGIAVFRLPLEVKEVDAFSFYHEGRPIVFLNTAKSAERMRFDAAHELGHLVLHSDEKNVLENMKEKEKEADMFASEFLMPTEAFMGNAPRVLSLNSMLKYKKYWKVSLVAINYRSHQLGLLSEWRYRSNCIEFSQKGYRSNEPEPLDFDKPMLLNKVIDLLIEKEGISFHRNINFGYQIFDDILFNLVSKKTRPNLRIAKRNHQLLSHELASQSS